MISCTVNSNHFFCGSLSQFMWQTTYLHGGATISSVKLSKIDRIESETMNFIFNRILFFGTLGTHHATCILLYFFLQFNGCARHISYKTAYHIWRAMTLDCRSEFDDLKNAENGTQTLMFRRWMFIILCVRLNCLFL